MARDDLVHRKQSLSDLKFDEISETMASRPCAFFSIYVVDYLSYYISIIFDIMILDHLSKE